MSDATWFVYTVETKTNLTMLGGSMQVETLFFQSDSYEEAIGFAESHAKATLKHVIVRQVMRAAT